MSNSPGLGKTVPRNEGLLGKPLQCIVISAYKYSKTLRRISVGRSRIDGVGFGAVIGIGVEMQSMLKIDIVEIGRVDMNRGSGWTFALRLRSSLKSRVSGSGGDCHLDELLW